MEVKLQQLMISTKLDYEANLISQSATNKHSSSHLFKYLHSMSKSHTMPQFVHYNGSSAISSIKKAELFNQYFNSVYHSHPSNILSQFSYSCSIPESQQLHSLHIDDYEVLSSLDPSKAIWVLMVLALVCSRHVLFLSALLSLI